MTKPKKGHSPMACVILTFSFRSASKSSVDVSSVEEALTWSDESLLESVQEGGSPTSYKAPIKKAEEEEQDQAENHSCMNN